MKAQTLKLWLIWFVLGLASGWLFLQIAGCNTAGAFVEDSRACIKALADDGTY